jgi:uncharacterized membrane protein YedE/YeeE
MNYKKYSKFENVVIGALIIFIICSYYYVAYLWTGQSPRQWNETTRNVVTSLSIITLILLTALIEKIAYRKTLKNKKNGKIKN